MVILRTLGECIIEVGAHRFGPGSPHLFGLLLYLSMSRGRTVPRGTLHAMFFPDVGEGNAGHSLRQLVYRLRSCGAPIETDSAGLRIATDRVGDDFTVLFEPAAELRADVLRAAGTFLPGYAPRLSAAFAAWVDEQRAHVHGRIRRTLMAELAQHKGAGGWEAAERTAQSLLAIDPLNEVANLAIAEAMAVTGNKIAAVKLLDRYIEEAGPGAEAVKLPAALLRRRIAERLPTVEYDANRAPFVGRADEVRLLHGLLAEARTGACRTAVLWGEPGIGKTRCVAEFCKAAVLGGASVVRSASQPHDERRPMGAFLDLTPGLLKLPGALGTSPEAMRYLQRLVGHDPQREEPLSPEHRDPEYLSACITRALSELFDAVTSEVPLVLVVEDVQWLDRVSRLVLADLLAERKERRLLLVATWRATEDPVTGSLLPERTRSIRLRGLAAEDAARLMRHQLQECAAPFDEQVTAWGIRTAQGNPFFLHELARHYAMHRSIERAPASLLALLRARLDRVPGLALQFLQATTVLGAYATADRVSEMLGLRPLELLEAVNTLEEASLLHGTDSGLATSHPLLSEVVLERCAPEARRLLHERAAAVLGKSDLIRLRLAAAQHLISAAKCGEAISTVLALREKLAETDLCELALSILLRAAEGLDRAKTSPELAIDIVRLADLLGDSTTVLSYGDTALRACTVDDDRACMLAATADARRAAGEPAPAVLQDCMQLLESTTSATASARAALLGLKICDECGDSAAAHRIHDLLARRAHALPRLDVDGSYCEMVYHSTFGNREHALALATRLAAALPLGPRTLRCRLDAALALARGGSVEAYLTQARAVYEYATEFKLNRFAFEAATGLSGWYIASGRTDEASRWHEAASGYRVYATSHVVLVGHLLCALIIASADGQRSRISNVLREIQQIRPKIPVRQAVWAALLERRLDRCGVSHSSRLADLLEHPLAQEIEQSPGFQRIAQQMDVRT